MTDYFRMNLKNPVAGVKTIVPDLERFGFPDEIKVLADQVYTKLGVPTKRGRLRANMLFFCVFQAYVIAGKIREPRFLAEQMDIDEKSIPKIFSSYSFQQTGYEPVNCKITVETFIPEYCERMNLIEPEHIQACLKIWNNVKKKDPSLEYMAKPQFGSAGIVLYYMYNILGYDIDRDLKMKKMKMTVASMANIVSKISVLDNST